MSSSTTPDRARGALGLAPAPDSGLTPLEQRIAYTRSLGPAFTDAVAAGLKPETLVRDAITALRNTPDLVKCEASTFAGALMSAAQLGLRPNVPSLGHGWVLPYYSGRRQRHEAQWILGYQGMVELGYKSGLVAKITTDTIYANEHYRIQRGTADTLVHEPLIDPAERGDPVAHYAIVWLQTGQCLWKVMPDADVRAIMERFAARDRQKNIVGPWRDDYQSMAQKTPLRALWRFMPKTPILALALATDSVVREGTDKDVVVQQSEADDGAPVQGDQPAKGDEPVEAEVVPDGPDPEPVPEGDIPDDPTGGLEPEPGPFQTVDGGQRQPVKATQARQAYCDRILTKHQGHARATVEQVLGEWIPPQYMTTAELRQVAEADTVVPPDAE